ncbi:MAG: hypothetical protein HY320_09870, partial [Armatimonadetes bacterium]|nr:hypothetical protein [Armatimonadota bacterium]
VVDLPQYAPSTAEADAAVAEMKERLAQVQAEVAAGSRPAYELPGAQAMAAWARDYRAAAGAPAPPCPLEMQALRIGDVALIATAGETFTEVGQRLKQALPLPRSVALGYSNGCVGYIPTEAAFSQGGYEVEVAYRYYGTLMLTPDCERLILAAGRRLAADVAARGV